MGLDGGLGEMQCGGDLGVRQAAGRPRRALRARVRQPAHALVVVRARAVGELVGEGLQQAAGDPRGDHRVARGDAADRLRAVPRVGSSSEGSRMLRRAVAAKAYSSRSKVVRMSTRVCGSSWTIRRVASMPSVPGMRTSIRTTSGRSCAGQSHGLGAVRRLADRVHVGLGVQDHAERHAQQRLVVGEQDADRHAAPSSGGSRSRRAKTRQPPPDRGPAVERRHRRRPRGHACRRFRVRTVEPDGCVVGPSSVTSTVTARAAQVTRTSARVPRG